MAVTTQRQKQSQLVAQPQYIPASQSNRQAVTRSRKQVQKKNQASGLLVTSGLKASLVGGFGFLILMLISLIDPPDFLPLVSLAILVIKRL